MTVSPTIYIINKTNIYLDYITIFNIKNYIVINIFLNSNKNDLVDLQHIYRYVNLFSVHNSFYLPLERIKRQSMFL